MVAKGKKEQVVAKICQRRKQLLVTTTCKRRQDLLVTTICKRGQEPQRHSIAGSWPRCAKQLKARWKCWSTTRFFKCKPSEHSSKEASMARTAPKNRPRLIRTTLHSRVCLRQIFGTRLGILRGSRFDQRCHPVGGARKAEHRKPGCFESEDPREEELERFCPEINVKFARSCLHQSTREHDIS